MFEMNIQTAVEDISFRPLILFLKTKSFLIDRPVVRILISSLAFYSAILSKSSIFIPSLIHHAIQTSQLPHHRRRRPRLLRHHFFRRRNPHPKPRQTRPSRRPLHRFPRRRRMFPLPRHDHDRHRPPHRRPRKPHRMDQYLRPKRSQR